MNLSTLKNILFYTFIPLTFIICIAYFFAIPLYGDDWQFSLKPLEEIYSLKFGLHPGRNISEFIFIFSDQILGRILGSAFNNYFLAIKLSHAFVSTFIMFGLSCTASLYINSQSKKIYFILFFLLSTMLPRTYSEFTVTSTMFGGLLCGLIIWTPFVYFYQKGRLPLWIEKNPDKFYGIWLALSYIGTQVHDNSNFLVAGMTILTLIFLHIHNFEYQYKPLLKKLLITHIIFSIFTLLRNSLLTNQVSGRIADISFDPFTILNRIATRDPFINISILLGAIAFIFLLLRYLKTKKIERKDFFIFTTLSTSLGLIIFLSILGTHIDQALWLLWITLINILISSFKNSQKYTFYILPTLILGLIITLPNSFNTKTIYLADYIPTTRFELIKSRVDYKLLQEFQTAEANNKNEIIFTHPFSGWYGWVSEWMYQYNYTSSYIPVVETSSDN